MDNYFKIKIHRLRVDCYIGWYDYEHAQTQPVYVSFECLYPVLPDIYHDDLSATLNYEQPCRLIEDILKQRRFKLLEKAILTLKAELMEAFPKMEQLTLTIEKPGAIDNADYASLSV